jgi:hypothetical protein
MAKQKQVDLRQMLTDVSNVLAQHKVDVRLDFDDESAYMAFTRSVASTLATWSQPDTYTRARSSHGDPFGILKAE